MLSKYLPVVAGRAENTLRLNNNNNNNNNNNVDGNDGDDVKITMTKMVMMMKIIKEKHLDKII